MTEYNGAPDVLRRIERAEERLNTADRELATLSSELHSLKENFDRRVADLKYDVLNRTDENKDTLRERIDSLRTDMNNSIESVSATMRILNDTVSQTTESLQTLHSTQNRNIVKVNNNEKITWAIIGLVSTGGLYLLQEFIKGSFGGS